MFAKLERMINEVESYHITAKISEHIEGFRIEIETSRKGLSVLRYYLINSEKELTDSRCKVMISQCMSDWWYHPAIPPMERED